jgi:hypothetical protein
MMNLPRNSGSWRARTTIFAIKIIDAIAARPKSDWKILFHHGYIHVQLEGWRFTYAANHSSPTLPFVSCHSDERSHYSGFTDVERFLCFLHFSEMWENLAAKAHKEPSKEMLDLVDGLPQSIKIDIPKMDMPEFINEITDKIPPNRIPQVPLFPHVITAKINPTGPPIITSETIVTTMQSSDRKPPQGGSGTAPPQNK